MRHIRYAIVAACVLAGTTATAARAEGNLLTCTNVPTAGTELRSPYAPAPAASLMQTAWAATELPGDHPFSYLVYVPENLPPGPVPVVMTIHGLLGNAKQHLTQTRWREVADARGFIVVAPNGRRSWEMSQDSVDVAFLRDVIADVRARDCVDDRRLYLTGHSNGAFMTHRLACESADLFAAGASYAAGDIANFPTGSPCAAGGASSPPGHEIMPLALWHGDDDAIIAYTAGRRGMWSWLDRYDCDTTPGVEADAFGSTETYGSCASGRFNVTFRTLAGHGHAWPDGCGGQQSTGGSVDCEPTPGTGPWPSALDLTEELWSYLSDHARIEPAIAQPAPTLPPLSPPRTDGTGAWADNGIGSGIDSESTFRRDRPLVGTDDALEVSLVLRVATGGDAAGIGPTHPLCPTANPGPSTQSMSDREITVSATDIDGEVRSVLVGTDPMTVTRPGGTIEHVEAVAAAIAGSFDPNHTIVRARYEGDLAKFWWGCGSPRAIYKETFPSAE